MRMRASWLLLAAFSQAVLQAQVASDSSVSVTGIVRGVSAGPSHWGLVLPVPVIVRGVPLNWLGIGGSAPGVADLEDRFVEAKGTLRVRTDSAGAVAADLIDPRLQEREPRGTVRRQVQLSYTQRAVVSLAVEPAAFAWRDSAGRPSGVRPIVIFSLVNHGDTPIQLFFTRYEVVCARVQSLATTVGTVVADTSWAVPQPGVQHVSIMMGQRFRQVIELPQAAAPSPGHYRMRVEFCTGSQYGADMNFAVSR